MGKVELLVGRGTVEGNCLSFWFGWGIGGETVGLLFGGGLLGGNF